MDKKISQNSKEFKIESKAFRSKTCANIDITWFIWPLPAKAGWRISVKNSFSLGLKLQKYKIPYKLVIFPGGDHGLNEYKKEVYNETCIFFTKYLISNEQQNINLNFHGK